MVVFGLMLWVAGFLAKFAVGGTAVSAILFGNSGFSKSAFGVRDLPVNSQLHEGGFTDDNAESMSNYFYDLPTTIARRNQHIFPTGAGSLRLHNLPDVFSRSGFSISSSSFLYPSS